ncbi:MAG: hypothetical protein NTV86_18280 [Planctomycetota bacterium]|nr:hypothetical protein [Planctomycetota bacterium]
MARTQALMETVSANLSWFLRPIGEKLTKPQKKFLREGLIGLLRAGRPVVLFYRLLTGLTEAITACVYAGRALL